MHHGVPRSSPTPTTDQRADEGPEPTPTTTTPVVTTVPATTAPTTTAPATTAPATTVPATTVVNAVVDVAGPPVPAAFQQLGRGSSAASSATATNATNAVVAAKGPLPTQALPTTGAAPIDTVGVAALLLVAGLVAVGIARTSRVARRRQVDRV